MVYSVESQSVINEIPYKKDFERWRNRLTNSEYEAIQRELNSKINGTEIQTSSWIPGSDWRGTVYEPIYAKACLYDESEAAKCFGLFLWIVMMERPETWGFGRYKKGDLQIEGLTYFIVHL